MLNPAPTTQPAEPCLTLTDPGLPDITLACLPRLQRLREDYVRLEHAFCLELPCCLTYYLRELDRESDGPELRAGRLNHYILSRKRPVIPDDNLLGGTTTSQRKGVMIHPESLSPATIWPELPTIGRREKRPFHLAPGQLEMLDRQIFPYWLDRTILERTRAAGRVSASLPIMQRLIFFINSKAAFIGHTIPTFTEVLAQGLTGMIQEAAARERAAVESGPREFYQAVQLSLTGLLVYAENLSRYAARVAAALAEVEAAPTSVAWTQLLVRHPELAFLEERWTHPPEEWEKLGDEGRTARQRQEIAACRENVTAISRVCAQVPAQPARTFREAVNAVWLCYVGLHQEGFDATISPGRLDQVLFPYFQRDLAAARDRQQTGEFLREAVELVGCLWLKLGDHLPAVPVSVDYVMGGSGCNQAVTLGGIDRSGNCAVNDLTYVMLRATELLQLRDPNVNARYFPGVNERRYLERLCQVNVTTGATPCFHNDLAAIEALKAHGVAEADARDYGAVGCVEPVSSGRTFGNTGGIWLNLTAALELALFQGKHRLSGVGEQDEQIGPRTAPPQEMATFPEFLAAFATQLAFLIEQAVQVNNALGETYQRHNPFPLLSALTEGCLERGKDVIQGGATYNSTGIAMIGLAEAVDSLTAIEKLVFQDQTVSFATLLEAISRNWQGQEPLRLQALGVKSPEEPGKFGTDSPLAKKNAAWLLKVLHDTCQVHQNYRGGRYTAGYWTMTTHAAFGSLTGALPSGRRAWESLPSGITPVSGAPAGDAAVYRFVAGLDHTMIGNGQALNLKYPPPRQADTEYLETYLKKFADNIEAYFRLGGLQVQYNLIDRQKLLEAKAALAANPRDPRYQDLLVRVSGYSAYFHDLDSRMQEEIISRTQFDLGTGRVDPWAGAPPPGPAAPRLLATALLWLGLTKPVVKLSLWGMKWLLRLKQDLRESIMDFHGSYLLRTRSGDIYLPVVFRDGAMHLPAPSIDPTEVNAVLEFRDKAALLTYLLDYATGQDQDLLAGVVRDEIRPYGNINYIFKFAFLSNSIIHWLQTTLGREKPA
jgi:pyruvate-formate lyase